MKYIASCSFGKNSLATIIKRLEHCESIDEVVYCRIMFDDNTSSELPEHEYWIYNHAIPLLKIRYGLNTIVVQSEKTYTNLFYSMFLSGKNIGRIYGFPFFNGPWCNNLLKTNTIKKYKKSIGNCSDIIGIAVDEKKRIERALTKKQIIPLVDYGITEKESFEICRQNDLLSPAYNYNRQRLGCWFCHNQCIGALRLLFFDYPDLWKKLISLDSDSPVKFKPHKTLTDFHKRFLSEGMQLTFF